jgi:multidrug transporter EmrE-like cation transporter
MAYRVGPPWFRRMLITVGMLAAFGLSIVLFPAGLPDLALYGTWAVTGAVGMYLSSLFGVKLMGHA